MGKSVISSRNYCKPRLLKILIFISILLVILILYTNNSGMKLKTRNQFNQISFFENNRNLSKFIKFDEETSIYKPIRICDRSDTLIVYFISSALKNHNKRNLIRETWGKDLKKYGIIIFLTGISENKTEMDRLSNEFKFHQDMIIENFQDTYNNLTIKTGFIFKNFVKLCSSAKYLMKSDDDNFLNTDLITNILLSQNRNPSSIIGLHFNSAQPHRNPSSKWYMPLWMYPDKLYPNYLAGFAYILPQLTVRKILNGAFNTPIVYLEDVFYTGIVANHIGIDIENDNRFQLSNPLFEINCFYRNFAAVHHVEDIKLKEIWTEINSAHSCKSIQDKLINDLLIYLYF